MRHYINEHPDFRDFCRTLKPLDYQRLIDDIFSVELIAQYDGFKKGFDFARLLAGQEPIFYPDLDFTSLDIL